jgi:hypothetical protein
MSQQKRLAGRPREEDVRKPSVVLLLEREKQVLHRAAKRAGLSFSKWAALRLLEAAKEG